MDNDIEKWSTGFLDANWAHDVIQPSAVSTLDDFYSLMLRTRDIRRQIVSRILKGAPIRPHFVVSLRNAKQCLESSCTEGTTMLSLKVASGSPKATVKMDITDELRELDKDLLFCEYVGTEDANNTGMENFVATLAQYHPDSPDAFQTELEEVVNLLTAAEHFMFMFSDRDGTLKSYSCAYPTSIQPCYQSVILATFAHRCTQYSAILTSAPLSHIGILDVSVIPDGYFCFGASGGREWHVDRSKKFKDNSLNDYMLEQLDIVYEAIHDMVKRPEFTKFSYIGSGLQKHYGHITVAKQDHFGSIEEVR